MRVGYTGEPGAFAEEAVLRFFASPAAVPMSSFRAVFEAVRDGEVAAGVVPVESSLLGTIRENLDLLWEFDLPVVGEVSVPVRLALLALPGERLESITRVYSISAALAQADEFLRSRPWTVQTTYNTAGAAKQVAERREPGAAAVASARVAPIYGLEVLADDIQSGTDNRTRFAVIARRGSEAAAGPAAGGFRAGGRPARGGRGSSADLAGVRRAERAGVAAPLPGGVRQPRAEPVTAGEPAMDRPRVPLGVPVLGGPRRRSRRPGLRGGAGRAARRDRAGAHPGHVSEGPRGLTPGASRRVRAPRSSGRGALPAIQSGRTVRRQRVWQFLPRRLPDRIRAGFGAESVTRTSIYPLPG